MARNKPISIVNVETALQIYNTKTELDNADIKKLFGISSGATVARLKKCAKDKMKEKDTECWDAGCVDTECAFEAWKINVESLERKYKKAKALGFIKDVI